MHLEKTRRASMTHVMDSVRIKNESAISAGGMGPNKLDQILCDTHICTLSPFSRLTDCYCRQYREAARPDHRVRLSAWVSSGCRSTTFGRLPCIPGISDTRPMRKLNSHDFQTRPSRIHGPFVFFSLSPISPLSSNILFRFPIVSCFSAVKSPGFRRTACSCTRTIPKAVRLLQFIRNPIIIFL